MLKLACFAALLLLPAPARAMKFIVVQYGALGSAALHPLILLPDGRALDTLALAEQFWARGFARDDLVVHGLGSSEYVSLQTFASTFPSVSSEQPPVFDRLVYDSSAGRFQDYSAYRAANDLADLEEVLSEPGTLVLLEPRINALSSIPDNCPFVDNVFQGDAGGLDTTQPDGIGDDCQCGDLTLDGILRLADAGLLRDVLAGVAPALGMPALDKCTVRGAAGSCDLLQVVVLVRALAGFTPLPEQICSAAQP